MRLNDRKKTVIVGALLAVVAAVALSVLDREAEGQRPYRAPRTTDGKPDLQGIWRVMNSANVNIQDHSAGSMGPAGHGVVVGGELPYLPAALEKKKQNAAKWKTDDPYAKCFLPGVPRATYVGLPFQIVQTPGYVGIAYEYVHASRMIYTNGTPHQPDVEWWMGDSRGKWEGETLVVDVTNLNDLTWFDMAGNHHSNELHVVERYTRTGPDHMQYEATIEDPKTFSKPWKMSMLLYRQKEANAQLFDYNCYAFDHNEKGLSISLAR
ncbi:MAG: hypothetical protein AB7I25_13990 [Vicinamibacterales bacterium]